MSQPTIWTDISHEKLDSGLEGWERVKLVCSTTPQDTEYKWKKNNEDIPSQENSRHNLDRFGEVIIIQEFSPTWHSGDYWCEVTRRDRCTVQSEHITLKAKCSKPTIRSTPLTYKEMIYGSKVKLTCHDFPENRPAMYTWKKDRRSVGKGREYTIEYFLPSDTAEYMCVIKGPDGATVESEIITVQGFESMNYHPFQQFTKGMQGTLQLNFDSLIKEYYQHPNKTNKAVPDPLGDVYNHQITKYLQDEDAIDTKIARAEWQVALPEIYSNPKTDTLDNSTADPLSAEFSGESATVEESQDKITTGKEEVLDFTLHPVGGGGGFTAEIGSVSATLKKTNLDEQTKIQQSQHRRRDNMQGTVHGHKKAEKVTREVKRPFQCQVKHLRVPARVLKGCSIEFNLTIKRQQTNVEEMKRVKLLKFTQKYGDNDVVELTGIYDWSLVGRQSRWKD